MHIVEEKIGFIHSWYVVPISTTVQFILYSTGQTWHHYHSNRIEHNFAAKIIWKLENNNFFKQRFFFKWISNQTQTPPYFPYSNFRTRNLSLVLQHQFNVHFWQSKFGTCASCCGWTVFLQFSTESSFKCK